MYCCTLLCVHSNIAIILMGKRELVALLNMSSWCLVLVERLFLAAVPQGCLQFVIVVFPDHTHLLNLWRNVSRCPSEIKAQCYSSVVRPVIEYAATDWDPYTARNIQQLKAVQRRAARFVTGDNKTTCSTSQMITNLGWSSC